MAMDISLLTLQQLVEAQTPAEGEEPVWMRSRYGDPQTTSCP
jgi:hypothetical protein